jgi:hypothetical protein
MLRTLVRGAEATERRCFLTADRATSAVLAAPGPRPDPSRIAHGEASGTSVIGLLRRRELERRAGFCHGPPAMRACLGMLALLLVPATGLAQDPPSAAVMAVGGTIGVEASGWVEAVDAIEARLREAGFRIDDSGLPRRDDCAELSCLRAERASRDVDVLVTLTLFVAEGSTDQVGSVVVTMVDASGQYVGDERVEGRVVSTVAALALAEARTARERGAEPWLRVSGTAGAIVRVDGHEVGVVPYEGRLTPGHHRVEVSLGGLGTVVREVDAAAGETVELDETLGGGGGGGDDAVVAGVLFGVAGGLAIAGGVGVGLGATWNGQFGQCLGPTTPPCDLYVGPGAGDGALAFGGTSLVVAGGLAIAAALVLAVN